MVNNPGNPQKTYNKKRQDGSIEVDYIPSQKKQRPPGPKPSTGEYIDYEDVK